MKTETKTISVKQFNNQYVLLVKMGKLSEEERETTLAEAVNLGEVRVGRGSYTACQQFILDSFKSFLAESIKEAEHRNLGGVKKGQVYNALGNKVDIALNMKTQK